MIQSRARLSVGAMGWCVVLLLSAAGAAGYGCAPAAEKAADAPAATTPAPASDAMTGTAANVVEVTVDGSGFHPDRIVARAGQPITLAITRTTDETCGTEIVIPTMAIDTKLPLNERVEVTVTPAAAGEVAFACAMNMHKGTIVVE